MKAKDLIKWFAINGAMAALLWFGFGPDRIDGARYVYTFYLCVFALFIVFTAFNDVLKATARAKGRRIPAWLDVSYDIVAMGFLVWHGSWVIALVVLVTFICVAAIFAPPDAPTTTTEETA